MTYADVKVIWDASFPDESGGASPRFDKIAVRMAEILNFKIYRNSTTQCTNTAVTPMLEQICEETLTALIATAKITVPTDPWDFVESNVLNFLKKQLVLWEDEINEIKDIESQRGVLSWSPLLSFSEG